MAIEHFRELRPDATSINLEMSVLSGLEAVLCSHTRIPRGSAFMSSRLIPQRGRRAVNVAVRHDLSTLGSVPVEETERSAPSEAPNFSRTATQL